MLEPLYHSPLPEGLEELEGLSELALDLRWTWSHFSDRLWEFLAPNIWERTRNPYYILQSVDRDRLEEVVRDESFKAELAGWLRQRRAYLADPGWFGRRADDSGLRRIAYYSMEFGISEALPVYSGGLGILAGDHLKSASDLGVPVVGIGLLYQQGYFRQILSSEGQQLEAFPYNDPTTLPVTPVTNHGGGLLRIELDLPGRTLLLRVWRAQVGKVSLYLLDSNEPLNSPWDRGITANLYPAERERRLLQELVLGVGGWRVLEALDIEPEVCHLNEGHAAFAALARARGFMQKTGQPFAVALRATRAGNIFTTHTPVAAAFDRFEPPLVRSYLQPLAKDLGVTDREILALGRKNPDDEAEAFNMAYLAVRTSGFLNGVSRLHGEVSRRLFQDLFPQWPRHEVPVGHVTNGVHMPSWDSQAADHLWTCACGKDRWMGATADLKPAMECVGLSDIWELRATGRQLLVDYVRRRLLRQLQIQGAAPEKIQRARHVLDPNALTLGFARRFTAYKRPTLLLHRPDRLAAILRNADRPVQLIVAGKAHPNDPEGKQMVQAVGRFAARPELYDRVVFLEDYDITLAQFMTAGIDVWLNTPRRPMEASGTSGMKVLVNGGLNLSELDGWWAEAYDPAVGWSLGDGREHPEPGWDTVEADQLYNLLERKIIPEFYDRDPQGIPRAWVERVRACMARLAPQFSSNRMLQEYVERAYLPAARAYRRRAADGAKVAQELEAWRQNLAENWAGLRFGTVRSVRQGDRWHFEAEVYCGELDPSALKVELYAEPRDESGDESGDQSGDEAEPVRRELTRQGAIAGAVNGHLYAGEVSSERPAEHYTPRIVPQHPEALVPLEAPLIRWQR